MRVLLAGACLLLAGSAAADDLATGQGIYDQTCIACHGADGKGSIPGVAKLTDDAALAKSDDELFTSIKNGLHPQGAMLSMPAKGGNPALTDADISAVLAFIRKKFGSQ